MCKLYFKYSTMNGGKSGILLMQAHQFEERSIPFLCFKPSIDTRDGESVIKSRVGIQRECIPIDKDDDIFRFMERYLMDAELQCVNKPLWLLIDEAQFLTKEQVDQLSNIVDIFNINVLCYGLRTDFTSHLFEGSKRLMELADSIDEIKVSCSCGRKAIINARYDTYNNLITDGEQILIGGNDVYTALCRKCFNKQKAEKMRQN